jgi:hypothetical protein
MHTLTLYIYFLYTQCHVCRSPTNLSVEELLRLDDILARFDHVRASPLGFDPDVWGHAFHRLRDFDQVCNATRVLR